MLYCIGYCNLQNCTPILQNAEILFVLWAWAGSIWGCRVKIYGSKWASLFAWCLLSGKCATDFVELQQKRIIVFFVGPYILWKESRYNPEEKQGKKYSEQLASDNFIECIAKNSKVTEQEIKYIFEFSCVNCVELLLVINCSPELSRQTFAKRLTS